MRGLISTVVIWGMILIGALIVLVESNLVTVGIGISAIGLVSLIIKSFGSSILSEIFERWREDDEWFRERIARPLLGEVTEASNGDFPGEPGEYQSKWETDLDEATRQRDEDIYELFDQYTAALDDLNTRVEQQYRLSRTFIQNFPGGKYKPPAYIIGDVMTPAEGTPGPGSSTGPTGPKRAPEPNGEEIEFQEWLQDVWPAFEQAESAGEFRSELKAQYHDLIYSNDTFDYWERQKGQINWEEQLWENYENDSLKEYYEATKEREDCEERVIEVAEEIREIMKEEIRHRYGKSQ